ncbi:MAG: hypothetical protein PF904_01575 [Kiritimatiellae bacterium]|jgi:hypothetical protein|nr:hypothetical protein [Kiritimatiellia bacterium]
MKLKNKLLANLVKVSFIMLAFAMQAAPVPVTGVSTTPGFGGGIPLGSGRVLNYVEISNVWYNVRGATCTECNAGSAEGAVNETQPTSRLVALSGLKITQSVLNIKSSGAKFDLGMTVSNNTTRILFSEVAANTQSTGDYITIYPTTNGVVVGSWKLDIVAADYADTVLAWQGVTGSYLFRSFITSFTLSDFSGDTGTLLFDGFKISGNNDVDPNFAAILQEPASAPISSTPIPATGIFSPGFVISPETNLQTLVGIVTSNGTSRQVSSLSCVRVTNGGAYLTDTNNPPTKLEVLSELSFTEVIANASGMEFEIGRTVNSDDGVRFFLSECDVRDSGTDDVVIVYPLYEGERIDNWCLEFQSSDYGEPTPDWSAQLLGGGHEPTFYGSLTSFALSDFTNGPPIALTGVNGFEVKCPTIDNLTADISVFGMYEMPPEGTIILVQ